MSVNDLLSPKVTQAWQNLFALLDQDDPALVDNWARDNRAACKQMFSGTRTDHPLAKPMLQCWEGLLDRGWLPQAQSLLGAVNGQVAADFMVGILARLDHPTFKRLEPAVRRHVKDSEVFESACVLGNQGVLERLLARGPQISGLTRGFARALRAPDAATSEWLWSHIRDRHLLHQTHVEAVLRQGRLDWFDRFRPLMTRSLWAPALLELLNDLPIVPEQHRALIQEGVRWFTPENDSPNDRVTDNSKAWLDQWLSQAVSAQSPWLETAVANYPVTSPTTAAFAQAARSGGVDVLAPVSGQADWAVVKKVLITRNNPQWAPLDQLASVVPPDVLQTWVGQRSAQLPRSQAQLRDLHAQSQAPEVRHRRQPRLRS